MADRPHLATCFRRHVVSRGNRERFGRVADAQAVGVGVARGRATPTRAAPSDARLERYAWEMTFVASRACAMSALSSGVSSAAGARRRASAARRVVAPREGPWSGLRSRASTSSASVAARPAIASRPAARALAANARRAAPLARAFSGEGRVEQLERQTRTDPPTPETPTTSRAGDAPAPETPSDPASVPPGPDAPPGRRRAPPGPFARLAMKLKLYALYAIGWTYKTFRILFSNRWFLALFAVFVASGSALAVKAHLARRAGARPAAAPVVLYSHFVKDLAAKRVRSVRFEEGTARILYELAPGAVSSAPLKPLADDEKTTAATTKKKQRGSSSSSSSSSSDGRVILQTKRIPDERLMSRLETAGVDFGSVAAPPSSYLSKGALTAMALWIPLIPLYFVMRNLANKQGGGGGAKKARSRSDDGRAPVTFADVAGVDEAKAELVELVDMLRSADKYKGVKNRLPTGCLLVGPPGTGKTLLAKAVAGEAGVPFFSVAASEFVELFVGRGAARVRELFAEARKASPAVIFIDELDAIGARRGAGLNEERDQTLNQMLVEMDGFNKPGGVLVLAATNRAEALDPALLRPGRLTRRVFVGPPNLLGRAQILTVHLRDVPVEEGLRATCDAVARVTPGFTGAELANVVNEGVLLAARDDREVVTVDDLIQGAERTKNGVGVGQGAAKVLGRLRSMIADAREGIENRGGSGGGGDGGGTGVENVGEANRRQGVGLSMPPT